MTKTNVGAHRVSAPSAAATQGIAPKRRHRTRLIYKETAPKTIPDGTTTTHDVVVGRCPRHSGAINGYYLPDTFGVNLQGAAVRPNLRRWEFLLDNQSGTDREVIFGIVCLKP